MKSIPKANEGNVFTYQCFLHLTIIFTELGSRSATDRNGKGRQHAHKPDTVARKRRKVHHSYVPRPGADLFNRSKIELPNYSRINNREPTSEIVLLS